MLHKKGFTLAEVLITLAIIGVVAAITIPSVIVNTNQMEFKTGLRKAVSVLNQAITMNKALTGESPYDNENLYSYLMQNMSAVKRAYIYKYNDDNETGLNGAFYTTDGMRYEFFRPGNGTGFRFPLYENKNIYSEGGTQTDISSSLGGYAVVGKCGSLGLTHNPDSTTTPPCIAVVDVNGDRKPSPSNMASRGMVGEEHILGATTAEAFNATGYKYADPKGRLLTDIFSIMITDQGAIPYGVVAQKAMYQAQK